jgi:hypothetical protein
MQERILLQRSWGGADQNLILLDEATIFNSSHVFGFFSVLTPML